MSASTTSRRTAAAALAGLALVASACGTSDGAGSATAKIQPKAVKASTPDLTSMLMRAGEEPGFRPGAAPGAMPRSRETFTGVKAFAEEMHLPSAEVRRLRSEGFIAFTAGPIRGLRDSAGITKVALYETAEGARRSMAHDVRPDVVRGLGPMKGLRFFTVPGVPGARGWAASEPDVANVMWVQGRCYLALGNQGSSRLDGHLATGVRAIYERTKGQCG